MLKRNVTKRQSSLVLLAESLNMYDPFDYFAVSHIPIISDLFTKSQSVKKKRNDITQNETKLLAFGIQSNHSISPGKRHAGCLTKKLKRFNLDHVVKFVVSQRK